MMNEKRKLSPSLLAVLGVLAFTAPSLASDELVLHWRFDTAVDNVEDDASSNGRFGHLHYNHFRDLPPYRIPDGVHGAGSGSVRLDDGSRVTSLSPFELPEHWTLSFWIKGRQYGGRPLETLKLGDLVTIRSRLLGPDQPWHFQADPEEGGHDLGWHEGAGDGWQRIAAPAFWLNTHVGGYMGVGWYRTTFFVPTELADREHELHFAGVDAEAWVYVNGTRVGERTADSTGQPLEEIWNDAFSVTVRPEHLNPGQANVLVVRSRSEQLADNRYSTKGEDRPHRAAYPLGNAGMFLESRFVPAEGAKHRMDLSAFELEVPDSAAWTHVALAADGEQATLYVNGQPTASDAQALWPHAVRRVALDFVQPGGDSFVSGLDDVRVYHGKLSEARVKRLSEATYRSDADWIAGHSDAMQALIHAGGWSKERAEAMRQRGAPDTNTLLDHFRANDDLKERVHTLSALRLAGGADVAEALIHELTRESAHEPRAEEAAVKEAITDALSDMQRSQGIFADIDSDVLAVALEHGGWRVRRLAARALNERGVDTGKPLIEFEDTTSELGLSEHLEGWHLGHGGAWGDVTGNGKPDLYIGSFADRRFYASADAPIPNMLLLNEGDRFTLSSDEAVRLDGRGRPSRERYRVTMALFADLTNDGALDLLVGNHRRPNHLFENRWPEGFRDVTPDADDGGWPDNLDLRNATVVDLDQDGLLDLILVDGSYRGRGERNLTALRNRGDFEFEDVSEALGFADLDTPGLGLATGDVNHNGRPDFFVAQSNRLFLSQADGTYEEYRPGFFKKPVFTPAGSGPSGAVLADMTGNGLLDLVFTVHGIPPQVFLYVNKGLDENGMPEFVNVTEEAGLDLRFTGAGIALPNVDDERRHRLLGAHLGLVDLDNSGRRDILLAMTHVDERGRLQPLVLRNQGVVDGVPRFSSPPVDQLAFYCTTPIADYDRDGRVDIFMASWYVELDNYMFRNVTEGGNYLSLSVVGAGEHLNSMGIGAVVRLYESGRAGEGDHLLGRGDIVLGQGYSVGDEARLHFGLGDAERCDLVVTWQGHEVIHEDVVVNRHKQIVVEGTQ